MDLINVKAELLPWFFLGQTFLLEGQPPTLDLLGIAVGHVYHYAEAEGRIKPPERLSRWYKDGGGGWRWLRNEYVKIGEDM